MKSHTQYKGAYTALITPFNQDGTIDFGALQPLVEWQIQEGIHGLVPTGTTGESPTLTHDEHCKVIQTVVEQTNARVPIIAGTGSNSTDEAIYLTKQAKDIGADASLQVTPYYNKPSQEGIYRHFMAIADAVSLPIIVYNIPGRTSKLIEIETMLRLFEHPNIIGMKDATGDINYTIDIIQQNKTVSVLSGDDGLALSVIAQGGHGCISVISNIAPKQFAQMMDAMLQNDIDTARTIYTTLYPLMKALSLDTNPIPIKYASAVLGLAEEIYRLPLCELQSAHKQLIDTAIKNLKLSK